MGLHLVAGVFLVLFESLALRSLLDCPCGSLEFLVLLRLVSVVREEDKRWLALDPVRFAVSGFNLTLADREETCKFCIELGPCLFISTDPCWI